MNFRVAMPRLLAAALTLAGMALSGPATAAGAPLVVYTARKYQLVEQLFQEYGRERGIEVKSVTDDGAPLIQRLRRKRKRILRESYAAGLGQSIAFRSCCVEVVIQGIEACGRNFRRGPGE